MKKIILCSLLASLFIVPSCMKDKMTKTYVMYEPVYRFKSEVLAEIKSGQPVAVQSPGKIYKYGNYIFLNEVNKGVHIIDNSNPSSPQVKSFISIPGNLDIAVKGTTLYADLYTDMLAIDISNPLNAKLVKLVESVFPERVYSNNIEADSGKIIVDWIKREATERVDGRDIPFRGCANCVWLQFGGGPAASGGAPATGAGGSMARFAIAGNYLYAVNLTSLNAIDISNPADPVYAGLIGIGWNIETIYPFQQKLFIGSSAGMFIYDISNPVSPQRVGGFSHAVACDPVVTDGVHAFVTLRTGNFCQGTDNQLDVINVQNLPSTQLIKTYPMTNPFGLAKDGNVLFICDGRDGLKVFDASNVNNLNLISRVQGVEAYDVIAGNNKLILVAKDGLYQYDYTDAYHPVQLSSIPVNR
jgi:hypothetical protein